MDFVTINFGKMNLWPVEHFFQHRYLSSKLDSPLIKTLIRFSSNQNIGEGESNFDDKYVEKNVQLVRGSSFRNDLLQNPYKNLVTPLDLKGRCLVKLVFSLTNTNMEWIINKTERGKNLVIHYENKFTKTLDLLIFCIYLLNFSLEFFIMIFFVTNQLNISKFLPLQIGRTLVSY